MMRGTRSGPWWNPRAPLGLGVLVALACAADAQQLPKFQFLREREDWSEKNLRTELLSGGLEERVKYISLGEDPSLYLTVGGRAGTRLEVWNNFNFGRPTPVSQDEEFLLYRAFVHGDLHYEDKARAFLEIYTAGIVGDRDLPGGNRPVDVDDLDVTKAFLDWNLPDLTLRAGRQAFAFGSERIAGSPRWRNTVFAWDGISAEARRGKWTITGWWSQFVPPDKHDFNEPDSDVGYFGLYASKQLNFRSALDLYLLGIDRNGASFNGTTGEEKRYTLGWRFGLAPHPDELDYELEAAVQVGEVGPGDIRAGMVSGVIGNSRQSSMGTFRVFGGFDLATGDREAGGDVETFDPLFPLGHRYLGFADQISRRNIVAAHAGVSVKPVDRLTVSATAHRFRLAERSDAYYNLPGGILVPAGSASKDVGTELDLTLAAKLDRHADFLIGYSRFLVDDVIEDSAATSNDLDFFYLALQYTF